MKMAQRVAAGLSFDESGRPMSVKVDERTTWLFNAALTELLYRGLEKSAVVADCRKRLTDKHTRNSDRTCLRLPCRAETPSLGQHPTVTCRQIFPDTVKYPRMIGNLIG